MSMLNTGYNRVYIMMATLYYIIYNEIKMIICHEFCTFFSRFLLKKVNFHLKEMVRMVYYHVWLIKTKIYLPQVVI